MIESQFVAIKHSDGSVSLMQFIIDGVGVARVEPTDGNIQAEVNRTSLLAPAVSWRRISPSEIPSDRTFRGAWKDSGTLQVDMVSARAIWQDKLREAREPLLAELDIAYLRALELNDRQEMARIVAEKQRLRDITADPVIAAATTPEQLKAFWPF